MFTFCALAVTSVQMVGVQCTREATAAPGQFLPHPGHCKPHCLTLLLTARHTSSPWCAQGTLPHPIVYRVPASTLLVTPETFVQLQKKPLLCSVSSSSYVQTLKTYTLARATRCRKFLILLFKFQDFERKFQQSRNPSVLEDESM